MDDDIPVASLSVSPASVDEDGAINLVYTVTLDRAPVVDTVVNLDWTGSATPDTDFTGTRSATITVLAGATSGSTTVTIDTTADTTDELDETVIATITSGTGYTISPTQASATGTIVDDDVPTITVGGPDTGTGDITVPEGGDAIFGIKVTGAAAGSTLTLTLADGTAISPADYSKSTFEYSTDNGATWSTYTGAAITVAAGDSLVQVKTTTVGDTTDEADETFTLGATLLSNGTTLSDSAQATILDAPLITANGLRAEYYGYNHPEAQNWYPTAVFRTHADDGKFKQLDSLTKAASIIEGRDGIPDATFMAYRIDYGIKPGNWDLNPDPVTGRIDDNLLSVRDNLGNNPSFAPGTAVNSKDSRLFKFVNNDPLAHLTAADGSDGKGLGKTTEATIHFGGQAYFDAGLYDFRITSDDGFRLKLDGQTVAVIDGRLSPTQSLFEGVPLSGGLVSFEMLYLEWMYNSCLRIEVKAHIEGSVFNVLGSDASGVPLFSDPSLNLSDLQDLVQGTTAGTYVVRTGLELDGDDTENSLTGTAARDALMGFGGDDDLKGGDGNDRINGGQGDDSLTGGTGRDVFEWKFGDQGTTTPAHDVISDFDNADYAGDVLDLRDLLQGGSHAANGTTVPTGINGDTKVTINADAGNLEDYLHFTNVGTDTVIEISSEGNFTTNDRTDVDQVITLTGVNLVGSFTNDNQVINDLLARGKLLADVPTA